MKVKLFELLLSFYVRFKCSKNIPLLYLHLTVLDGILLLPFSGMILVNGNSHRTFLSFSFRG